MNRHSFGLYYEGLSQLHQLDARIKVPAAFLLILVISLFPQGAWPVFFFVFFLLIALQIASEIPILVLFRRSLIVVPFMLAALPLLFTVKGAPLVQGSGNTPWLITEEGVLRFLYIFLKSWLSVQTAILLAATTKMMDLLNALRVYHMPKTIVMIFRLMWRYLTIMTTKAQRMMRARSARSVSMVSTQRHAIRQLAWRAKSTGSMAGSLFVQSLEQSERVYTAMLSRGFDGEIRLVSQNALNPRQKMLLYLWGGFCLLLFILSIIFG